MTFALPAYPGRGIAVHRHRDGRLEWIYLLTGRSEPSRARTLVAHDDHIEVVATDAGALDPLRHYTCVRTVGSDLVIGNGDHVEAIAVAVHEGQPLEALLEGIEPEPDPPIHTPRIAVVASRRTGAPVTVLAVRDDAGATMRTLEPVDLAVGDGVLVHTYGGGVDAVVTDAVPRRFTVDRPGTDVAGRLWHELDPALRVAVAVGIVAEATPTRVLTERVR